MNELKTLHSLHQAGIGQNFLIDNVVIIKGELKRRLLDLSVVPEPTIELLKKSSLGDLISYRFSVTVIALKAEESKLIFSEVIDQ